MLIDFKQQKMQIFVASMQTSVWAAARMLTLHTGSAPIWRLRQYRHETRSAPGGVQGRAALRAGAKGNLCPHRRRLDSESFPPGTQVVKPEIHTVFLGFPTFFPKKNLSPPALADGSKASPQLSASPGRVLCWHFCAEQERKAPGRGRGALTAVSALHLECNAQTSHKGLAVIETLCIRLTLSETFCCVKSISISLFSCRRAGGGFLGDLVANIPGGW